MRCLLLPILIVSLGAAVFGGMVTRLAPEAAARGPQTPGAATFAIFFDWDDVRLSPHAMATLAEASRAAATGHGARIDILAADGSSAGGARRAALAQARWNGLQAELRREGVAPDRIRQSGPFSVTLQARPATLALRLAAASAR